MEEIDEIGSPINVEVDDVQDDLDVVEKFPSEPINSKQLSKESPNQKPRLIRLPLARVKSMMKADPDCGLISQDSLFLVTKAAEMFIEYLAKEAGKQLGTGKRKTVLKRDVGSAIESLPNLCFLDGALE